MPARHFRPPGRHRPLGGPLHHVAGGTFVARPQRISKIATPWGDLGFTVAIFATVSEDACYVGCQVRLITTPFHNNTNDDD